MDTALAPESEACQVSGVLIRNHLQELAALGPLHLALGVFDGVHLGHQAVIARAVEAAKLEGGLSGLLTFDPHPLSVLAPEKMPAPLLETSAHKAKIVAGLGVELFVPLKFDAKMAKLSAEEFLTQLFQAQIRTIAVGEDWRFGCGAKGDVSLLRKEAEKRGFRLEAVSAVAIDGERISSTRIRQAIFSGDLKTAKRLLGRDYSVTGKVIRGEQLGRMLGFPTANVSTGNLLLPPDGVWAVTAQGEVGKTWNGVANLGVRPTIGGRKRLLEVHLFGFSGDLYGKELEVCFEKKLREEMKFPSLEALQNQIQIDSLAAQEFFRK